MITAMMLAYNCQNTIIRAITCLRKFDEIIIVNNGSTDKTKEYAQMTGVKILDYGMLNDFSKRRNEAAALSSNDFVFWLDSDEIIDVNVYDELVEIFKTQRNICVGFKRLNAYNLKEYIKMWYPDVQWRAYNKNLCNYEREIHCILNKRSSKPVISDYHIFHSLLYDENRIKLSHEIHIKITKTIKEKQTYTEKVQVALKSEKGLISNLKGVK